MNKFNIFNLKFKEYIKKVFNLYNYEEKVKIEEIRYIINMVEKRGLNYKNYKYIDLGGGRWSLCL